MLGGERSGVGLGPWRVPGPWDPRCGASWGVRFVRLSHTVPSRNIQVDSPYEISRGPDELHYTYLDTFGRQW